MGFYNVGIGAGAGALAGYLFGLINPVGGAVFGATYALTGNLASILAENLCMNNTALKTAALGVSLIGCIAAGICATAAVGFPVTVLNAVCLTLAMIVTGIAVRLIGGCISSCAFGAGLTARERIN